MNARRVAVTGIVLLAVVGPAGAGDWEHELTPYLWAVGQDGRTGEHADVGDLIADYDLSPGDILDRLDGALLLAYRAEKSHTRGVTFDVVYMNLDDSGNVGPFDVKIDARQLMVSGAYTQVFRPGSPWWWSGGVRYADIDNTVRFQGGGPIGVGAKVEPGDSWFDPFVGVSHRRELSPRWHVGGTLEAGGFGVGSDSTLQALLEAGYDIGRSVRLRFGYRWLDVDYDDEFVFDATSQGFLVGFTFGL